MQQLTSTFHRIVLTLPFPSILAVFSISIHCQEQTFLLTPSLSMSLSLSVSFLLAPLAACVCLFTGSIQTRTQTFHGSINLLPSVAETLRKIHWEMLARCRKEKRNYLQPQCSSCYACGMPPATCHLPPVARKHLTPHTLPRPALTCHGSWCIQANAVPHTRCIILCLSFLSGTSPTPTRRPFSSSRFILFYFFRIHKSLWRTLSACLAATPTEYFPTFFWPARVKLSIDTFHTHTHTHTVRVGCEDAWQLLWQMWQMSIFICPTWE